MLSCRYAVSVFCATNYAQSSYHFSKKDINVILSFKINIYSTYMYYFILIKKAKGSNNDLQNIMHRKLMNEQHETH
jgi:hypothetical protein